MAVSVDVVVDHRRILQLCADFVVVDVLAGDGPREDSHVTAITICCRVLVVVVVGVDI